MIDVPVRVKDALRDGRLKKNYRILVLNDDGTTDFVIDNDTLVSEKVDIDERMCSGDKIKFGLCEGSSLECQYFNHPNISGRQLQVFVDVQYMSSNGLGWYSIPLGFFTVKSCSRQASTNIMKIIAYNKLMSDYLDKKANELIEETFGHLDNVYATDIIDVLLKEYAISPLVISTEGIETSGVQTNYETAYSYRYTNLYGDKGVFSPGSLMLAFYTDGATFSTSTNCQMGVSCSWEEYNFATHIYPVRVRFDDDFDNIDRQIADMVNSSLEANMNNSAAMKNILGSCEWVSGGQSTGLKGWYLHVEVVYLDGTRELFGKTLFDMGLAKGTFADLNNITLNNVRKIYLVYPMGIWLQPNPAHGALVGTTLGATSAVYSYYDSSVSFPYGYIRKTINNPTFSNGDPLTYEYYPEHMTVGQVINVSSADMVSISIDQMHDVTLRELQSATFETQCQFGKLDRVTDLFSGVELNNSRLYPAENLYPADNLYPDGAAMSSEKSMYSKLWADEGNIQKWRNLIITYKGLDENNQEKDFTLERVVNADGTQDYNMSDNWLFKNLVWTAADIGDYADAMVNKMRAMTWFPYEMWCAGLPYIETGDEIEISVGQTTYTSYVLQRELKGIQNLQDTFINGTLDIF